MVDTRTFLLSVGLGLCPAVAVAMPPGGWDSPSQTPPPIEPPPAQVEDDAGGWIDRMGSWAYVVAPGAMICVAILPIPAEIPAAANGMMFGPVIGTLITWLGAIIGAVISFEVARRWGRPVAERLVKPTVIERADRLVASAGWPGLLVLRLVPAVAFTAINWASGLTRMPRSTFIWTTAVGILPGAILFTSSGSGLAMLYRTNPLAAWVLGLAAIGVLWWTVTRYRRPPWLEPVATEQDPAAG